MIKIENTTLMDFNPEKIKKQKKQKAKDQKVMDLLGRFTAKMLMDALRKNGHPKPEWGDGETWRFYYLDECRRRGTRLLNQLRWPSDENAKYVNLYTGSIQTLWEIATSHGYFADRYTIADKVWSVIEHWEPYDPSKPNQYLIKYLERELKSIYRLKTKGKLASWEKHDIKKIPEYEARIKTEQQKNNPQ